jgi:hypothetical protein
VILKAAFTIYENPADHPGWYVIKVWVPEENGMPVQDPKPKCFRTLEQARASLPKGLRWIPRTADDDPVVKEVWSL